MKILYNYIFLLSEEDATALYWHTAEYATSHLYDKLHFKRFASFGIAVLVGEITYMR